MIRKTTIDIDETWSVVMDLDGYEANGFMGLQLKSQFDDSEIMLSLAEVEHIYRVMIGMRNQMKAVTRISDII